jgi:hypothetical protein
MKDVSTRDSTGATWLTELTHSHSDHSVGDSDNGIAAVRLSGIVTITSCEGIELMA